MMKRALYTLGFLAFAALSAASCQKALTPDIEQEGKLVTVNFIAESLGTKTGILEEGTSTVSYKWTQNDVYRIYLFTVSQDNTLTRVEGITNQISNDGTLMTITATVPEGSTVRAMLFPANANIGEGSIFSTTNQTPTSTSFDSSSDVLVAEDEVVTAGRTEFSLIFHRKVVVSKMTLVGLPAGEKIQQVDISSKSSGKMLAGTLPMAGGSWQGTGTTLEIKFNPDEEYPEGSFPVYFTTIPNEDVQLHLVVYTDLNVYEKDLGGLVSFNLGQFTKFSVALPEGTPIVGDTYSWDLSETDLTGNAFGGVKIFEQKGTPPINWMGIWLSALNPSYSWDPNLGMQIGIPEAPCTNYLLSTNYDELNIQSVRVYFAGEGASLRVAAGGFETPMTCGGQETATGTAALAYYTFTTEGFLRGSVKIFVDGDAPFYFKSVEFNPVYDRGTAGQVDSVNGYNTSY